MTKIESKEVAVSAPIAECFEFLLDMNNYELLLPQDKISNWVSDEKQCSFKIQNTYKLTLVYSDSTPSTQVLVKSGPDSPFKFDLFINMSEEPNGTKAQLVCNADINPFLKMMVQKPLNNLFDYMADRLAKVKGTVS
jgi:carbon monoxide dehydrogenase subunit G